MPWFSYWRGDINVYQQRRGPGVRNWSFDSLEWTTAFSSGFLLVTLLLLKCCLSFKSTGLNNPWCACTPPGKEQLKLLRCVCTPNGHWHQWPVTISINWRILLILTHAQLSKVSGSHLGNTPTCHIWYLKDTACGWNLFTAAAYPIHIASFMCFKACQYAMCSATQPFSSPMDYE